MGFVNWETAKWNGPMSKRAYRWAKGQFEGVPDEDLKNAERSIQMGMEYAYYDELLERGLPECQPVSPKAL